MHTSFRLRIILACCTALICFAPMHSDACSRVLWAENAQAVVVGRTMDWMENIGTNLWAFPRGIQRNGEAGKNSITWTSKYGSVVSSVYDIATADGINEKGLGMALLWLAEADYGERDEKLPALSISLWGQYMLDNFATVKEAVAAMKRHPFQVRTGVFGKTGLVATAHLSLADASGDSAVIEILDGKTVIHHGKQYNVLTNSPTFDQQLQNLKQYSGFGGNKPLPGTSEAADRFVRASFYVDRLPPSNNRREAVAGVLSVIRNVAQPFGKPDALRPNQATTQWHTVSDLTNKTYYYESSMSPNLIWVKLQELNLKKGAPTLKLDVLNNPDRVGDVSDDFVPTPSMQFMTAS